MSVYKYSGRTKTGELKKGVIQAANKNSAVKKLRDKGINPREVVESNSILHKEIEVMKRVKAQDFVMFCRQFATLVRAGVSIVESTHVLALQSPNKLLKNTLFEVEEDLRSGKSFSQAVAKHPKIFPELFVNLMKTGEATGNIDSTLERLANTYEKQYKMKKKIQSTMAYPLVLFVIMIAVVGFLLVYIVPSFVTSFEAMGADLPWSTVKTVAFSGWLIVSWWKLLMLIVAGVSGVLFLYKKNEQFYFSVHYVLLRIPVFGKLVQMSAIARLLRNLSSLFSSAVPILQALTISERVSGNPVISKVVVEARKSLENGSTLTEPLQKSWLFPPMVTSMTQIGEATGSLDYMLEKAADFYEEEVDRTVDTLKSFIEPLMILLLAGVVGFIVAAIMLPMFSLYDQM